MEPPNTIRRSPGIPGYGPAPVRSGPSPGTWELRSCSNEYVLTPSESTSGSALRSTTRAEGLVGLQSTDVSPAAVPRACYRAIAAGRYWRTTGLGPGWRRVVRRHRRVSPYEHPIARSGVRCPEKRPGLLSSSELNRTVSQPRRTGDARPPPPPRPSRHWPITDAPRRGEAGLCPNRSVRPHRARSHMSNEVVQRLRRYKLSRHTGYSLAWWERIRTSSVVNRRQVILRQQTGCQSDVHRRRRNRALGDRPRRIQPARRYSWPDARGVHRFQSHLRPEIRLLVPE